MILGDLQSRVHNGELYFFQMLVILFVILFLCCCVKQHYKKSKVNRYKIIWTTIWNINLIVTNAWPQKSLKSEILAKDSNHFKIEGLNYK
jgi:hypothetical protein